MGQPTLVAGIDSSTQSCKVVVCDAATGAVLRHGSAPHPVGTEIEPRHWWDALQAAVAAAGGLRDVAALSVAGQQHGLVSLDQRGQVIRPALLWNDTRSAEAAERLVSELGDGDPRGGAQRWAEATGSVPVASFTVTKLRWLADHEPQHAARIAALALPHDWLTWRLQGAPSLDQLTTDRSDASGTGYFDPRTDRWRRDLLGLALRRPGTDVDAIVLPRVVAPNGVAGTVATDLGWGRVRLAAGCGDNAGAALGLQLQAGDVMVSIGTSGVIAAVGTTGTHDASGTVAGFADATGRFLPLACTLNGSRVLDAMATTLGVDQARLSDLALQAPAGADGLVLVPYLEGERTPNLPHATGSLHQMTLQNLRPTHLARAAVEGLLCLLADAMEAVRRQGVTIGSVTLVGGAARSAAVRELASPILGTPVQVPPPAEYVALGAARQAAWSLTGGDDAPTWPRATPPARTASPTPALLERYQRYARTVVTRQPGDTVVT